MVTVLKLPAQPIPKQVTAKVSPGNLQEHALAFLNHYNRSGFDSPEHEQEVASSRIRDLKTVGDVLLRVGKYETLSGRTFKALTERLFELLTPAVSKQEAKIIIATALGHDDYALAIFRDSIENKNFNKKINEGIFDAPRTEFVTHLARPYSDTFEKLRPYLGKNLQDLVRDAYLDTELLLEFLEKLETEGCIDWSTVSRQVAILKNKSFATIGTGKMYNLVSQLAGHSNIAEAKKYGETSLVLIRDKACFSKIIQVLKD